MKTTVCLPRSPEHKGKVESGCRYIKTRINPTGRRFDGLAELQAWSDERLNTLDERRTCPATGRSVHETWLSERELLRDASDLPEVFDVAVSRPVHRDCTVNFEGRSYVVPFHYVDLTVEVRGCAATVQFFHGGRKVAEWPRGTERRLLVDQASHEKSAMRR